MLDSFKRASNSWIAKIFMGILILSFGLSGIAYVFLDLGSSTIGRVGNESISTVEFERAYRSQLNNFANQYGRVPTPEQAAAFGIPGEVLNSLSGTATLDNLITAYGVGASDEMVATAISEDPNFSSTLGLFDEGRFNQILAQSGYTQGDYVALQTKNAQRSQLIRGLFEGSMAPKTILEIANRIENDSRTLDYFEVGENSLGEIAAPTEEELATYLTDNQFSYKTEEIRNVDVLIVSPEVLAKNVEVTEAQIEAEYEKTGASFVTPATRNVKEVTLANDGQANLLTGLSFTSATFDNMVSSLGLDTNVVDLGNVAQADITDTAVADAAFGLEAPGISIVVTETAQKVIFASDFNDGGQQPLSEIRNQIAQKAAEREAKTFVLDQIDEIEELRATLSPIKDIAAQFNLDVQTVDVAPTGSGLEDVTALADDSAGRVLQAISVAELDKLLPAVSLGADSMAWFDLNGITEARDQTVEEVRPILVASWLQEQKNKLLAEKAQELVASIEAGEDIATVANTVGQFALPSLATTRSGDGGSITASVANVAFQGGEGYSSYAPTEDGNYIIFQVSGTTDSSTAEINEELLESLSGNLADNLFQQYISAKRDELGYSVNQEALAQILALSSGQ